jgi:transcriptional regulator with XRE-family HTH domain
MSKELDIELLRSDLSTYIDQRKWSQSEFCRQTGCAPSTISRLISGDTFSPDMSTILEISNSIGRSVHRYFHGTTQPVKSDNKDTLESIKNLIDNYSSIRYDCKEPLFKLMFLAYTQFARLQDGK